MMLSTGMAKTGLFTFYVRGLPHPHLRTILLLFEERERFHKKDYFLKGEKGFFLVFARRNVSLRAKNIC